MQQPSRKETKFEKEEVAMRYKKNNIVRMDEVKQWPQILAVFIGK